MGRGQGSVTVEASIVVTFALAVTFFVLFLAAYLHDMHRLGAVSEQYARLAWAAAERCQSMDGRMDWDEWEEQSLFLRPADSFSEQEQVLYAALENARGNMWFGNTCTFHVALFAGHAEIRYEGVYHFPFRTGFGTDGIFFSGGTALSGTGAEEWIRLVGGVVRGLGGEENTHGNGD